MRQLHETEQIILAGNGRRAQALGEYFPGLQRTISDDSAERMGRNPVEISRLKADWATMAARRRADHEKIAGIGSDTQPKVGQEYLFKPANTAEIQQNFTKVAQNDSSYTTISANTVELSNGFSFHQSFVEQVQLTLDPQQLTRLTTLEGAQEYLTQVQEFFAGQVSAHDIAGGFSAEVLVSTGAVQQIDDLNLSSAIREKRFTELRQKLAELIHIAVVTISPQTIQYLFSLFGEKVGQTALAAQMHQSQIVQTLTERTLENLLTAQQTLRKHRTYSVPSTTLR